MHRHVRARGEAEESGWIERPPFRCAAMSGRSSAIWSGRTCPHCAVLRGADLKPPSNTTRPQRSASSCRYHRQIVHFHVPSSRKVGNSRGRMSTTVNPCQPRALAPFQRELPGNSDSPGRMSTLSTQVLGPSCRTILEGTCGLDVPCDCLAPPVRMAPSLLLPLGGWPHRLRQGLHRSGEIRDFREMF
jgi:hypothetical protein